MRHEIISVQSHPGQRQIWNVFLINVKNLFLGLLLRFDLSILALSGSSPNCTPTRVLWTLLRRNQSRQQQKTDKRPQNMLRFLARKLQTAAVHGEENRLSLHFQGRQENRKQDMNLLVSQDFRWRKKNDCFPLFVQPKIRTCFPVYSDVVSPLYSPRWFPLSEAERQRSCRRCCCSRQGFVPSEAHLIRLITLGVHNSFKFIVLPLGCLCVWACVCWQSLSLPQ